MIVLGGSGGLAARSSGAPWRLIEMCVLVAVYGLIRRRECASLKWPHLELLWLELAPLSTYQPLRSVSSAMAKRRVEGVEGEIESGAVRTYPT